MTWKELKTGAIFGFKNGNGTIYECAERYHSAAQVYILDEDLERLPDTRFGGKYKMGIVSINQFDNNNAFEYENII